MGAGGRRREMKVKILTEWKILNLSSVSKIEISWAGMQLGWGGTEVEVGIEVAAWPFCLNVCLSWGFGAWGWVEEKKGPSCFKNGFLWGAQGAFEISHPGGWDGWVPIPLHGRIGGTQRRDELFKVRIWEKAGESTTLSDPCHSYC